MKSSNPRSAALIGGLTLVLAFALAPAANAQDWFKAETGMGVTKVRLAAPEFGATSPQVQPLEKLFHSVLWNDLDYSGILDMVSASFYPLQAPTQPAQLKPMDWSQAPVMANMITFGYLGMDGNNLAVYGYLFDVGSSPASPVLQKVYRGMATEADARRLAHQFADDIIATLGGGVPGIAQTHIAFVHSTGDPNVSEIWEMDYDGATQHQLTHLRTNSLTPRWSPDGSRIAFTCFVPGTGEYRGARSAQICLYSLLSSRMIAFPRFLGTTATPAWSPDGKQLAFMSGETSSEIFVSDVDGNHAHALTQTRAANVSPVWNPKTGQQIVFVSDRDGSPVLFMMNSDGSNAQRIPQLPGGYVVDPAWSPNGQLLAFSLQRPGGNFDLYVMDIASNQLVELTRDEGRNERPSWAPDGRHLVFASTRSGSWQIWSMLADGSEPRQLTFQGDNESPNWSPQGAQ